MGFLAVGEVTGRESRVEGRPPIWGWLRAVWRRKKWNERRPRESFMVA
jgi:hypothetical protein